MIRLNKTNQFFSRHKTKLWFAVGFVALIAVVTAVTELTNITHLFHKTIPATQIIVKAGNPIPSPKNNTSTGSSSEKTSSSNPSHIIGGGADTNGSASASTKASQWVISQSGNITVKQPIANAKLQTGAVLSGSAKVSVINFRLIDTDVGKISEGTLRVVNGNFSGRMTFTTHSSSGRLDVFSTNDQGVELNEVQIAVSF